MPVSGTDPHSECKTTSYDGTQDPRRMISDSLPDATTQSPPLPVLTGCPSLLREAPPAQRAHPQESLLHAYPKLVKKSVQLLAAHAQAEHASACHSSPGCSSCTDGRTRGSVSETSRSTAWWKLAACAPSAAMAACSYSSTTHRRAAASGAPNSAGTHKLMGPMTVAHVTSRGARWCCLAKTLLWRAHMLVHVVAIQC